jgi:hypothetical protein
LTVNNSIQTENQLLKSANFPFARERQTERAVHSLSVKLGSLNVHYCRIATHAQKKTNLFVHPLLNKIIFLQCCQLETRSLVSAALQIKAIFGFTLPHLENVYFNTDDVSFCS